MAVCHKALHRNLCNVWDSAEYVSDCTFTTSDVFKQKFILVQLHCSCITSKHIFCHCAEWISKCCKSNQGYCPFAKSHYDTISRFQNTDPLYTATCLVWYWILYFWQYPFLNFLASLVAALQAAHLRYHWFPDLWQGWSIWTMWMMTLDVWIEVQKVYFLSWMKAEKQKLSCLVFYLSSEVEYLSLSIMMKPVQGIWSSTPHISLQMIWSVTKMQGMMVEVVVVVYSISPDQQWQLLWQQRQFIWPSDVYKPSFVCCQNATLPITVTSNLFIDCHEKTSLYSAQQPSRALYDTSISFEIIENFLPSAQY